MPAIGRSRNSSIGMGGLRSVSIGLRLSQAKVRLRACGDEVIAHFLRRDQAFQRIVATMTCSPVRKSCLDSPIIAQILKSILRAAYLSGRLISNGDINRHFPAYPEFNPYDIRIHGHSIVIASMAPSALGRIVELLIFECRVVRGVPNSGTPP